MCPNNCVYTYYDVMRKSKDKKYLRFKMVQSAEMIGIKPTAKKFKATKNTVKLCYRRWKENGYQGLEEQSRRPHHSPNATSETAQERLVKLKKKYTRLGADQIKIVENVPESARTMREIWREKGVSSRKLRKKHMTKANLRAVKKEWRMFRQICEDTKDLTDIPEYWTQMKEKGLPG